MKLVKATCLALWLLAASASWTQTSAQTDGAEPVDDGKDAAESRATAFQAVEGPQKEQVPGGPLLIGAYAFVMVLLVGYVARLGSLQSRTAAEVQRLTRALERGKPE